jgi:DNA modification methylase
MIYLQDPDVTILQGDSLELLQGLPSGSVHMACTSPPFYGLRDYSVDGQIGLEATPDEWVQRLVGVFRELRRVLRDDGSLWVEIGDSYAGGGQAQPQTKDILPPSLENGPKPGMHGDLFTRERRGNVAAPGYKPKDLIGAPWLLAFALRADGWFLRSEIIWAKPNPMPESVTDRPTVSHSRVFLLTKSARYFYDAEAIREPHQPDGREVTTRTVTNGSHPNYQEFGHEEGRERWPGNGRNRRSVWTIPTQPYPEAHFATWPEKLVEPMILAGTSERGVCPVCGAPWERIVEGRSLDSQSLEPRCRACGAPLATRPAVVLDVFGGAGTTAVVARRLGRKAILLELNPDYCALAARRLQQQSLFAHSP